MTWKTDPRGIALAAVIRPPCDWTIDRQIDSPIPIPSVFVVKKASKIRFSSYRDFLELPTRSKSMTDADMMNVGIAQIEADDKPTLQSSNRNDLTRQSRAGILAVPDAFDATHRSCT
jgi:hypothetical protein